MPLLSSYLALFSIVGCLNNRHYNRWLMIVLTVLILAQVGGNGQFHIWSPSSNAKHPCPRKFCRRWIFPCKSPNKSWAHGIFYLAVPGFPDGSWSPDPDNGPRSAAPPIYCPSANICRFSFPHKSLARIFPKNLTCWKT